MAPEPTTHDRAKARDSSPAWFLGLAAAVIVLATVAAYWNSFSKPFVFDDRPSIEENPTIRHLGGAWGPPAGHGITVEGRPVLNFSFALNYAFSGTSVGGYHATNLAIHLVAALTLFGLVRRTLLGPVLREKFGGSALVTAWSAALLWALHPLQTESVTYLVQRAESLMGLCYLLTLYAFARGAENTHGMRWFGLSFTACLLGMGTKEVMVSAPLIVALYDRTFFAGSFREAWRQRWKIHGSLLLTWLLLAGLVLGAGNRGGTAGLGVGVSSMKYALTQFQAVAHYLWLVLWPHPLIFDYGTAWVSGWREVLPYAVVVLALVTGTCVALGRWPVFGFLGVWFFAVLAPTSSVLPGNRQTLAEHRMYLPLAPVLVLGVGLVVQQMRRSARGPGRLFLVGSTVGAIGLALAFLTAQRNEVYDSELVLYRDTVTKRPGNDIARYNLAGVLAGSGALEAAVAQYEASIQLKPDTARVHYNLANALMDLRRVPEAVASYEAALRLDPKFAPAHLNLGDALVRLERRPEAVEHYRAALQLRPDFMEARDKLGTALLELGQWPEAEAQLREVLNANPNLVATHCNLGTVYLVQGKRAEAREQYEEALQLAPDFKAARDGLERTK